MTELNGTACHPPAVVSRAMAAVLDELKHHGPASAAELAGRLQVSKKAVRGRADRLRRLGLVQGGDHALLAAESPPPYVVGHPRQRAPREDRFARPRRGGGGRPTLTTGEVAYLFDCAPRTVSKWCNEGLLKCYRLPGCLDRRVRREDLAAFCRAHNLAVPPGLLDGTLLVGLPAELVARIGEAAPSLTLTVAPSAVEAGHAAGRRSFGCVVVDCAAGRTEALRLVACLAGSPTRAVVLANEDDSDPEPFLAAGAAAVLARPIDLARLVGLLLEGGR